MVATRFYTYGSANNPVGQVIKHISVWAAAPWHSVATAMIDNKLSFIVGRKREESLACEFEGNQFYDNVPRFELTALRKPPTQRQDHIVDKVPFSRADRFTAVVKSNLQI
jgi:hypothetical protein